MGEEDMSTEFTIHEKRWRMQESKNPLPQKVLY